MKTKNKMITIVLIGILALCTVMTSATTMLAEPTVAMAASKKNNKFYVYIKTPSVSASLLARKDQTISKTKWMSYMYHNKGPEKFSIKKCYGKYMLGKYYSEYDMKRFFTIDNQGTITVRRGLPKGRYTIVVNITDTGNSIYASKSWTKNVRINVR